MLGIYSEGFVGYAKMAVGGQYISQCSGFGIQGEIDKTEWGKLDFGISRSVWTKTLFVSQNFKKIK